MDMPMYYSNYGFEHRELDLDDFLLGSLWHYCGMERATGPRYDNKIIKNLTLNNICELSDIVLRDDDTSILGIGYYQGFKYKCVQSLVRGEYTYHRAYIIGERIHSLR